MRDIEMGSQAPIDSSDLGLEAFSEEVDFSDFNQVKIKVSVLSQAQEIEMLIDRLSKQLKKLKEANEESKVSDPAAIEAIKQHIGKDIGEVGKVEQNLKEQIEELKKNILGNKQEHGRAVGTRVDCALKKKFKDIMSKFQTIDCMMNTIDGELKQATHKQDWGQVMDISAEIQEHQKKMERIKLPGPQGPSAVDNKSSTTQVCSESKEFLTRREPPSILVVYIVYFLVIIIAIIIFST